jgi:hypothetical protein
MGISGEKKEPVGDGIHHAVRDLNGPAFLGDVTPDVVELGLSRRCKAVRHQ